MVWTVQYIVGLGYKTTDYKYDLNGNILKTIYQDATSERFEHRYTYDKNQRLKLTETKAGNGVSLYQAEEKLLYYLHGPLKRRELAVDLQGIDYMYTIQGWLKSINNPTLDSSDPGADGYTGTHSNFANDAFGMMLEYYNSPGYLLLLGEYGQYGNNCSKNLNNSSISVGGVTDLYDGTVKAFRWQTKGQPIGTGIPQYVYQYDKKYQLKAATFGNVTRGTSTCSSGSTPYNVFASSNAFKVSNINYDANGNMTSKYTYDNTGASSDAFGYNPISGTNQLASVQTGVSTYYAQYQYNAIGQMSQQTQGTLVNVLDYDVYEKVVKVTETSTGSKVQVQVAYNEFGYRTQKKSYNSAGTLLYTTYYVNDINGNVQSIYDDNDGTHLVSQKELPVYGSERVGMAYKSTTYTYRYELTDHLGNVRVVINRTKVSGQADIYNWKDYYPHGAVMPGRTGTGSQRYDFQGQYSEKDPEGNLQFNAFELRMYDARVGRWLNPDPMGQYWSPYLAMGNNPVAYTDPTGGDDSYSGGMGGGDENGGGPNGNSYYGYYGYGTSQYKPAPMPPPGFGTENSFGNNSLGGNMGSVGNNYTISGGTCWGNNGISYNPSVSNNSFGGNYMSANNYSYDGIENFSANTNNYFKIDPTNIVEHNMINNIGSSIPRFGRHDFRRFFGERAGSVLNDIYNLFDDGKPINPIAGVGVGPLGIISSGWGRLIGWGEGQAPKAVQQTINITTKLTKGQVQQWIKAGLPKTWVQKQLNSYTNAMQDAVKSANNTQLKYRKELMQKILDLWD